jgi:glutathione S-transferase
MTETGRPFCLITDPDLRHHQTAFDPAAYFLKSDIMKYTLLIGDRSYSSWSLRGWLCFAAFDIPVTVETTRLYDPQFQKDLARFAHGRTVPAVRTPDSTVLTDSLSIAWHLAESFPDHELLPTDPNLRANAMNMIVEMHAGFQGLRSACPMNLRTGWTNFQVSDAVQNDLARLEMIWSEARAKHDGSTPWLCGAYSLADAYFAPVATRIATYDLPVTPQMQDYVDAHLSHSAFINWRTEGMLEGAEQPNYEMNLPRRPFPLG